MNLRIGYGVTLTLVAVTLCSCSTNVHRGNNHLADLKYSRTSHPGAGDGISTTTAKANMQEEMAVVEEIREAWKLAAVKKDKEGALKILRKLDEEHPGISTIQMMMGQVEELFGNSKGAVVHYRKAHSVNEFSSVQTYKLAESLRKSGDAKGSIVYYEKLEKRLETAVGEFDRQGMKSLLASVRSGMAEAMLDAGEPTDKVLAVLAKLEDFDETSKKRGARVLHRVISKYPNNQEAKMLLKKYDL